MSWLRIIIVFALAVLVNDFFGPYPLVSGEVKGMASYAQHMKNTVVAQMPGGR